MIIGTLKVELLIHDAFSLKDKRRVVKSLKDRLSNDFKVSIAEIDQQELHNAAVLGVAIVSNSSRHAQEVLDKLLQKLRDNPRVELIRQQPEILTGI